MSLAAAGIALWVHPIFAWLLAAIGGSYALMALAASAQLSVRMKSSAYLITLPIVFAVRHFAHGLGAVYGLVLLALPGLSWRGRRTDGNVRGYPGQRLLNLLGALVGLVIMSPVLIVLGLLVKLDSPGPVLYRGERLGRLGKPFHILKFRTMVESPQKTAPITVEGDGRITRVGRFLRRSKLDELPQLFNVMKGEMSLVGPRPECAYYFQYYAEEERRLIHSVRPGLTDYGSLRFHDEGRLLAGSPDPVKFYLERIRREKVDEQLRYIREQSFLTDLKIIVRTIVTIIITRLKRDRTAQPIG